MKKWIDYFQMFLKNKVYMLFLALTGVFSYGFLVTHHTIGIDDTPYAYYFEEGLSAIVGRWVMVLLNKAAHISDFAPFLTDLVGVLFFMAAVTVWSVLFYSVLEDKVPMFGYLVFSCVFISSPLLSEVFTYYLHNGVAVGYLCCGISLCFLREAFCKVQRWEKGKAFLAAAVFLWIALGCYEAFMIVWLLGLFLLLLTERFAGCKRNVFGALCAAAGIAAMGIVLRSVMIAAMTGIFDLGYMKDEAVQRSVTEMASWMFQPGALSEFAMVLKRIFVMYGVFAYAYYPIRIFVYAALVILVFCIWRAVLQKDLWCILLGIGSFAVSFLLVIVEGKATLYRSAQFLPVICAYGALLLVYACRSFFAGQGKWHRIARCILTVGLSVVIWNQCTDMNKWFYVDYLKYEDAKNTMNQIAYELEKGFDTSKPVVFTGTYEIPRSIIEDAYVAYGSETFYKMNRLTSLVDEHLLEKYYRSYGVWVAQTPALSVLDWGRYAFDTDEELVRFFAMHGHTIQPLMDTDLYAGAEDYSLNLPHFPKEGAIVDMGEYIIVHF